MDPQSDWIHSSVGTKTSCRVSRSRSAKSWITRLHHIIDLQALSIPDSRSHSVKSSKPRLNSIQARTHRSGVQIRCSSGVDWITDEACGRRKASRASSSLSENDGCCFQLTSDQLTNKFRGSSHEAFGRPKKCKKIPEASLRRQDVSHGLVESSSWYLLSPASNAHRPSSKATTALLIFFRKKQASQPPLKCVGPLGPHVSQRAPTMPLMFYSFSHFVAREFSLHLFMCRFAEPSV